MNLEQLQAMSDAELNELSAVKVMDWIKGEYGKDKWYYKKDGRIEGYARFINKWNPTTDMNDAMELLNMALKDSKYFDATISIPINTVIFHRYTEELIVDTEDSLLRAIIIASILAKEE